MSSKIAPSFLLAMLLFSTSAHAEIEKKISVTGTCTRQTSPDRGSIILTAENKSDDIKVATKKTTESYERLRDLVNRLRLENGEIKTVEYQVQEIREWEKNKSVSKGFRARMGMQVSTSDIQRLGEVIGIASRESIQDVGALTLFLSDEKKQKERMECLETAAQDARKKAEKLATALGARAGKVVSITENGEPNWEPPQPMAMRAKFEDSASSAPPVDAGKQKLSVSIQAAFEIN